MVDTKQKQKTEFAAFVGIDWADQKHAWALQIPGHAKVELGDLDHTPEAVEVWAGELARRFGGGPIAVALEQSRGLSAGFDERNRGQSRLARRQWFRREWL